MSDSVEQSLLGAFLLVRLTISQYYTYKLYQSKGFSSYSCSFPLYQYVSCMSNLISVATTQRTQIDIGGTGVIPSPPPKKDGKIPFETDLLPAWLASTSL